MCDQLAAEWGRRLLKVCATDPDRKGKTVAAIRSKDKKVTSYAVNETAWTIKPSDYRKDG
jgi:hypothetical protein